MMTTMMMMDGDEYRPGLDIPVTVTPEKNSISSISCDGESPSVDITSSTRRNKLQLMRDAAAAATIIRGRAVAAAAADTPATSL